MVLAQHSGNLGSGHKVYPLWLRDLRQVASPLWAPQFQPWNPNSTLLIFLGVVLLPSTRAEFDSWLWVPLALELTLPHWKQCVYNLS